MLSMLSTSLIGLSTSLRPRFWALYGLCCLYGAYGDQLSIMRERERHILCEVNTMKRFILTLQ